jgi:hypothetical protein
MPDDLIARLAAATEPSRELDEAIAIAIGMWKPWASKHRYWNFDDPDGAKFHWPTDGLPNFDPDTGKRIKLSETPPSGWAEHANLPEWTASIDAGRSLLLPGMKIVIHEPDKCAQVWMKLGTDDAYDIIADETAELVECAVVAAALRARGVG